MDILSLPGRKIDASSIGKVNHQIKLNFCSDVLLTGSGELYLTYPFYEKI